MITLVKEQLKRFPLIFKLLKRVHSHFYSGAIFSLKIRKQILRHIDPSAPIFFVQVGSNDGIGGDPLRELILIWDHWRGIFIEPVDYIFARLQANYGSSERFTFEQLAISVEPQELDFHYVSSEAKSALGYEFRYWYEQLGSFDRDHILKHVDGKLAPYIVSEKIKAVPLHNVLEKHGVAKIDILHIDTEGHDYQVMQSIDLSKYQPAVVLFEHEHLSAEDKVAALRLLKRNGYHCRQFGGDTLATKKYVRA